MTPIAPKRARRSPQAEARAAAATVAVGYLRVSTDEQADSGAGLDAQRDAITKAAAARGWDIADWCTDAGVSGSVAPGDRGGMACALDLLTSGGVGILLVSKLDRCSRDISDFALLLERARREGWQVVALDLGVDTTTPVGEMVAHQLIAVSQWERRIIGERTSAALQARKARGQRLGRPVAAGTLADRRRIRMLHLAGHKAAAIADALNADGSSTATGLPWTARHVYRTLDSLRLDDEAESTALGIM